MTKLKLKKSRSAASVIATINPLISTEELTDSIEAIYRKTESTDRRNAWYYGTQFALISAHEGKPIELVQQLHRLLKELMDMHNLVTSTMMLAVKNLPDDLKVNKKIK